MQSDFILDKTNLNTIRELLFIIRMWGVSNEGVLPAYTRTAESFDVIAKLFSLITRLKEGNQAANDSITDECILLPSQVMIPPLDIVIPAKGLAHVLLAASHRGQAWWLCTFNEEPTLDSIENGSDIGGKDNCFDSTNCRQYMDHVRHIHLGRKPLIVKECTRCRCTTSFPSQSSAGQKVGLNKLWDQRWVLNCFCGGPWKLTCLEENSTRTNLLSCI